MPTPSRRKPVESRDDSPRAAFSHRFPGDPARAVVFFALVYLYLWLWVQPCLIYGCATITNFPVFYRGWAFFQASVSRPGGLVQYLCAFAAQFFEYSWAGAAVITLLAWALSACTGYLLRAVCLPGARLLRFVPALLVLAIHARYSYHLPYLMGALASLASACLYVKLVSRGDSRHAAVYLGLSVVLYVLGAGAVLPFAVLCAAYELHRRRWRRIGLYLPAAVVLPYVAGVLAFHVSIIDACTELLPISWRIRGWATREKMVAAVYAVYLLPLLGLLAGTLWHLLSSRLSYRHEEAEKPAKGPHAATNKPRANPLTRWASKPAVQWVLGLLVLLAVGTATAVFSLDSREKALLQVHHYACKRMWPEVLAAARRCPDSSQARNAVNRALYHTGRLGTDLFRYVQQPESLLITGDDHAVLYWHAFDTLMDLGLVNLAEKNLTECLETFGEHPWILERLALVNLVKGRTDAARIYLGVLQKTLFHSRWASDWLARLDADPNLAGDSEIRRLRACCPKKDSIAEFYAEEAMLTTLVEQAGGNRMAFEYLTAGYLLKGQLARVVQLMERLDEFGWREIPPLYQEALLIYAYGTGKPVDLHGRVIGPEMHQRFKHFSSIAGSHGNDRAAAIPELARSYAGSYFFYYFCVKVANR